MARSVDLCVLESSVGSTLLVTAHPLRRTETRMAVLSSWVAAFLAIGGACIQAAERKPMCFTNELAAFTNGQTVLRAINLGNAQDKIQAQALAGTRVLFTGSSWEAPRGTKADLNLGNGILLKVELTTERNVRPHGAMWRAEVVGVLKDVDFEKRIVTVRTRPEEWQAYWVR